MKMKKIIMYAALAAMIMTSCKEVDEPGFVSDSSVAYVSVRVDNRPGTRASDENPGIPAESTLNELYLVTFDASGRVMAIPGSTLCYTLANQTGSYTDKKPEAAKISASSKNLVVIANPGGKLKDRIVNLKSTDTYATFNAAIAETSIEDIMHAGGFTMITSRSDKGMSAGNKIENAYVEIGNKLQTVSGTTSDADAKTEAEKDANRLEVKLERLASKLRVYKNSPIQAPDGAKADMSGWTVDARNTTYYPFAEKTLLTVNHLDGDYDNNFYTKDPNFFKDAVLGYSTGIEYVEIDGTTFAPKIFGGSWNTPGADKISYVIENTMNDDNQVFGSATRIVMEATYYPKFTPELAADADWFSWAGIDYPSLTALQDAYRGGEAGASSALKDACDDFTAKVKAANTSIPSGALFTDLTQEQLNAVQNGGQAVKNGNNPVIRWYQKGRCYYYYEIRHDNETAVNMAFGKYGVVRNNWYDLTLKSVNGPGTPWYPEVTNPGPGDPDPKDPIDEQASYLGVTVQVNDWIIWTTDMDVR
ncbi:MAG: Mfa1 family fimbria major subunit [Bacteroidales bacterium]|jgi:hypothetical protein|nr:Mfa1 family fimbria major subunit [Bacteroidales bacterium]